MGQRALMPKPKQTSRTLRRFVDLLEGMSFVAE